MSKASVLRSPADPPQRFRPAARSGAAARARVARSAEPVRPKVVAPRVAVGQKEAGALQDKSMDGSSTDSSCSLASVKTVEPPRKMRQQKGVKSGKRGAVGRRSECEGNDLLETVTIKRRCAWITPNADPVYTTFHDEEWGVPVHDDQKLYELLSLSIALAELSWPIILKKREMFRALFATFDPVIIAGFTEKKILELKSTVGILLSEQKLRVIIENARQALKVIEELGSLDRYFWSFVNNEPVSSGFRYPHKVPVKTPKSEAMSKDLVRRGFQCTGPTVVYSFMQASGIVNDHLTSCFRFKECSRGAETSSNTDDGDDLSNDKGVEVGPAPTNPPASLVQDVEIKCLVRD